VSLLVLVVGFAITLPYLSRPDGRKSESQEPDPDKLRADIEEGRRGLGQGKFHLALKTLNTVIARRSHCPGLLSPGEHRQLIQLQRQADFFARLLVHCTLEDIVQHGKLVRDVQEWEARFNENYRGRSVLLDDSVRRDLQRRAMLANHVFEVDDEIIRVALEDVTLLRDLPLDDGPRLIFGARLQSCTREEGGGWVVHFEADSGVLLTEQSAVEVCLPEPGDDLRSTLARQQRWLDERGGMP
jgi:hypothetical protein